MISTVVCCFAFLYLLFGLDLNIPLAIALVGLLYLGLHLLMVTYDPQVRLYEQTLKEANRKLNGIRQSARQITDRSTKMQVLEIIEHNRASAQIHPEETYELTSRKENAHVLFG